MSTTDLAMPIPMLWKDGNGARTPLGAFPWLGLELAEKRRSTRGGHLPPQRGLDFGGKIFNVKIRSRLP